MIMSDNFEEIKLVEDVTDNVSTDIVTDLKTGIYSLSVSLMNHYIVDYGLHKSVELIVEYLEELSHNFSQAIKKDN